MVRRRRILGVVVAVVACTAMGGTAAALLGRSTATPGEPAPSPVASQGATSSDDGRTGCTLLVDGRPVALTNALAMTLTDIAGRDQNAAATQAHTAASVAAAWPEEAASSAAVALALRGYVPGALACTGELATVERQAMLPMGLTPRAKQVWDAVTAIFGTLPGGGFMPGGVRTGHMAGSAHYEGRAIDFLYRPISAKSIRHGWVLAQWLEAHATELQIAHVIFDAHVWEPGPWANRGWQPYVDPEGPTTNPTLLHEDHVHVDVQRGA